MHSLRKGVDIGTIPVITELPNYRITEFTLNEKKPYAGEE
jgi:hypothetical protein